MNILMVEDNPRPRDLLYVLQIKGHNVTYCNNLSDAEMYVTGDEMPDNGKAFDILILDTVMNSYDLPLELQDEARICGMAGWVFYTNVVKPNNEDLYKKTIIFTAYAEKLKRYIDSEEFCKLNIISKNDMNLSEKFEEMIKSIVEKVS